LAKHGSVDANQGAIVKVLREIPGVTVALLSQVGAGVPDLLVGYRGRNYLWEIKDPNKPPSKRRLTIAQERFHAEWRGQIGVAETFGEILESMKIDSGVGLGE